MRIIAIVLLLLTANCRCLAAEPCTTLHGRAHYYGGDGQLRIWHIGTHHEFTPGQSSWDRVMGWLLQGVPFAERKNYASPESSVYLFGDFEVCPTEPLRKGAVQEARVMSVAHRVYTKSD
ncbi:hypothetical protein [Occallatibacter riparius]|uniref:Uncharacterized protein n=1 Tax=Occallatibacter riparius TaxID=1002689 RepID=A0A9J7BX38_9BACT|nr:hypothetical protein [Occallatibacter riparius]UWZ85478.1 hypothetical protein MOP44_05930 [Occallatibacter riparius]